MSKFFLKIFLEIFSFLNIKSFSYFSFNRWFFSQQTGFLKKKSFLPQEFLFLQSGHCSNIFFKGFFFLQRVFFNEGVFSSIFSESVCFCFWEVKIFQTFLRKKRRFFQSFFFSDFFKELFFFCCRVFLTVFFLQFFFLSFLLLRVFFSTEFCFIFSFFFLEGFLFFRLFFSSQVFFITS